jgi:hypothetical protein
MVSKKFEKLEDLTPDPENANDGTARGASALETSLSAFGAGRSIAADRDGVVWAGNKTLQQAVELGFKPKFVHTSGDELVVVIRDDMSLKDDPAKVRAAAYADNRVAELSLKWNPERIMADLNEGLKLPSVFFTDEEIAERFGTMPDVQEPTSDTPELENKPKEHTCPACGNIFSDVKKGKNKT